MSSIRIIYVLSSIFREILLLVLLSPSQVTNDCFLSSLILKIEIEIGEFVTFFSFLDFFLSSAINTFFFGANWNVWIKSQQRGTSGKFQWSLKRRINVLWRFLLFQGVTGIFFLLIAWWIQHLLLLIENYKWVTKILKERLTTPSLLTLSSLYL